MKPSNLTKRQELNSLLKRTFDLMGEIAEITVKANKIEIKLDELKITIKN